MATAVIDGITTRYEVIGSGEPLLMLSPGGFDATLEKWRTQSIYAKIKPLDNLATLYTCIAFDRRETGQSGGRIEKITWGHYVAQAYGLLRHLGIDRAHVMGACMGVGPAVAFGIAHPSATRSLLLYWPVGGARYRIRCHLRFAEHLTFVEHHGLQGVVDRARAEGKPFGQDPKVGPWGSVIRRDPAFAEAYLKQDLQRYRLTVYAMGFGLFDRDTAPGAEPEDMMRLDIPALVVPGNDEAHSRAAARYLEECLPKAEYWDVPVEAQTETAAPAKMFEFLEKL